jgi:hypothetical protein
MKYTTEQARRKEALRLAEYVVTRWEQRNNSLADAERKKFVLDIADALQSAMERESKPKHHLHTV